MALLFANNASTKLAASVSDTDTEIVLQDASRFPVPGAGEEYFATLTEIGPSGREEYWEIVKVTSRSGAVLTVERAQDDTIARDWPVGAIVEMRAVAEIYRGIQVVLDAQQQTIANATAKPSAATYIYDSEDRISSISETLPTGTRTTTYTYDLQGRVTQVVQTLGSTTQTTTYTYDANGNLTGFSVT